MSLKLAINGGERVVPEGIVKAWPPVDELDEKYVLASLRQDRHAFGPNCEALQEEWKRWNDNKYCLATNSGTAALHMGASASGCGPGDEIIVTAFSWSSSATSIMHHNCIPVFVDIDFDTMNMDPAKIEKEISEKTRAIMVVHILGLPANMGEIKRIAKKYNLKIIEDACQAHGAKFKGVKTGKLGDCAGFSLNQNKNLCGGEGGFFVTDDDEIIRKATMLWSFGEIATPSEKRDFHSYGMGWMYRASDLASAFARAQLTKLDDYLGIMRKNAEILKSKLQGIKGLILPVEPEGYTHNWYNFACRIEPEKLGYKGPANKLRDSIIKALNAEGAPASIWQRLTLPAMTVFQTKNGYGKGCPWKCPHSRKINYDIDKFPVAQRHMNTYFIAGGLKPPNTEEVVRYIGDAIRKVFDNIDALDVDKICPAVK